jgi:hypothetical protein
MLIINKLLARRLPVTVHHNRGMDLVVVSEGLLFKANSAIFQLYHGENKLIFNDMMIWSALY